MGEKSHSWLPVPACQLYSHKCNSVTMSAVKWPLLATRCLLMLQEL